MKKIIGFLVVVFLIVASSQSFAQQKLKFGHVDAQAILNLMPEQKNAADSLEKLRKSLADELEIMQVELNKKYDDYLKNKEKLTEAVRKNKESEITSMQQRISTFQSSAEEDLQKGRTELMKPILDKLKKAISDVGKGEGFIYIYDVNSVLYYSEQSQDVAELVKAKLGIKK